MQKKNEKEIRISDVQEEIEKAEFWSRTAIAVSVLALVARIALDVSRWL